MEVWLILTDSSERQGNTLWAGRRKSHEDHEAIMSNQYQSTLGQSCLGHTRQPDHGRWFRRMTDPTQFLVNHGAPIVFVAVFLEQMGLPLPVVPLLLAAGALSATGQFSLLFGLGITVLACLIADTFWFYLGRYRGHRVLGLLCRISLEPDSCVRRTQNVFTRYGLRGVVVAKFVPGLGTVAPPLAGMAGVKVSRFLLADGLGFGALRGRFPFPGLFVQQPNPTDRGRAGPHRREPPEPDRRAWGDLYRLQILAAAADSAQVAHGADHAPPNCAESRMPGRRSSLLICGRARNSTSILRSFRAPSIWGWRKSSIVTTRFHATGR